MEVYLDNAATTAIRATVVQAMSEAMLRHYGNPSSTHKYGRDTRAEIEEARNEIAQAIGARASEIVFTSGGTEADNLVIRSCVAENAVRQLISTRIEHHAVLDTVLDVSVSQGIPLHFLAVDAEGRISLEELREVLAKSEAPALVSLMHVNNEIGTRIDLQAVAQLCQEFGAYFHSDTVQSIGHYPLNVSQIPLHFLAASAHKFHGPKGIGFAYLRKGVPMRPLLTGGSQQRGLRAGTEPYEAIIGMQRALREAIALMEEERLHITALRKRMWEGLQSEVPGIRLNGSEQQDASCYRILNVRIPLDPAKAALLLFQLDLRGVACSQGSACMSGSQAGSHVLEQILSPEERAFPSLRFSFSGYNRPEEIDYAIQTVGRLYRGEA